MVTNKRQKNVKGIRLYNLLLKELGELNKLAPEKQQISIQARRKIVSKELYPKYKAQGKYNIRSVRAELKGIVKKLPPVEICNPIYLPEAYLSFVEYYEIDNHIRTVLPDCINVRVNAGDIGKTKIFNTKGYGYYDDGVRKIIENIRTFLADNGSGRAYFDGIVKLKHNKPNNGNANNYFVDYILFIGNEPAASEQGANVVLDKTQQKKSDKVFDFIVDKFDILEKEKKKRKRIRKKKAEVEKAKRPEEQIKKINENIAKAINSFRDLLKSNIITKVEFEQRKTELQNQKKIAINKIKK